MQFLIQNKELYDNILQRVPKSKGAIVLGSHDAIKTGFAEAITEFYQKESIVVDRADDASTYSLLSQICANPEVALIVTSKADSVSEFLDGVAQHSPNSVTAKIDLAKALNFCITIDKSHDDQSFIGSIQWLSERDGAVKIETFYSSTENLQERGD